MVGPSNTEAERESGMNRLQAFVVALVGGSGALVALYADAALPYVAAGAVGGTVVGLLLWRYLVWTYRTGTAREDRGSDDSYEKRERFD
jgi:O-antigen/teichoic acid export membrane protein